MQNDDVICLTSASNLQEAHLLWEALEQEGVRSQVVGDYLTGGIGVGVLPNHYPELWVQRGDFTRARAILEAQRKVTTARPGEDTE